MEKWESELITMIDRYCERHNAQIHVVVARQSQLVGGEANVTLTARSKIMPELLPAIATLVNGEIEAIEKENSKPKIFN